MLTKTNYLPLKVLLLALITSLLIVNVLGNFNFHFQAFSFKISIDFWPTGKTIISIPPLGQISASTHDLPLKLFVQLKEVDINKLEQMLNVSENFYEILLKKIKEKIYTIFLQLILAGILVSITVAALLLNSNKKTLIGISLLTFLFITLNLLGVYYFYQPGAFQAPTYSGTLESAPWMMDLISESLLKIEELNEKMNTISQNIYLIFEKIENLEPLDTEDNRQLKILHISDIHNNIIALDLIKNIVNNFEVDLIIDTGDIVDYGTSPEGKLISEIKELNQPYIFAPGNHDSPHIINRLENRKNIKIINREILYKDLIITGIPDPLSLKEEFRSPNQKEITEHINEIQNIIQKQKQEQKKVPQIIAVHNHQIARGLKNEVPLILHGHTHTHNIELLDESIIINAGTTGASGLRSLETTKGTPPYTMVLIRLNKANGQYHIQALDSIKITDIDQGFTLKRQHINRVLDSD